MATQYRDMNHMITYYKAQCLCKRSSRSNLHIALSSFHFPKYLLQAYKWDKLDIDHFLKCVSSKYPVKKTL